MFDRIFQKGLDVADDTVYYIIDVGSKFKSMQSLLQDYLKRKYSPRMVLNEREEYVETEETKRLTALFKKRRIIF